MEIRELLKNAVSSLIGCGVENASFEARQILEYAGLDRLKILTDPVEEVPDSVRENVEKLLEKRISGYPLQYLLGEWEFYGLPFKVGEGVLIPRQDTEVLVEIALEFLKSRPQSERKVLDLCSGSGCIGITLAKLADADVTLVEKSDKALAFLRENVKLNEVDCEVLKADVLEDNTMLGEFDVIVSNPPYLTKSEMQGLQCEVRFEPEMALFGGDDGLIFYRRLLPKYSEILKTGGLFAVEIGDSMDKEVMQIFRESGYNPDSAKDSVDINRVIHAIKE